MRNFLLHTQGVSAKKFGLSGLFRKPLIELCFESIRSSKSPYWVLAALVIIVTSLWHVNGALAQKVSSEKVASFPTSSFLDRGQISELVLKATEMTSWGTGFSLHEGLRPIIVQFSGVGVFVFGAGARCSGLLEALKVSMPTHSGRRTATISANEFLSKCENFGSGGKSVLVGFLPFEFQHTSNVLVDYNFYYHGVVTRSAFEKAVKDAMVSSGLSRALLVTSLDASVGNVREVMRTVVHESTHLFGQSAWVLQPCQFPGGISTSCRSWLVSRANSDSDYFGYRPIEKELCLSAQIVSCSLSESCRIDPEINITNLRLISGTLSNEETIQLLLQTLVSEINDRTLGRSKVLESYWLLTEGVPTFMEGRVDKYFGMQEEIVSRFKRSCEQGRQRTVARKNIHHLYVGAALLEGFSRCLGNIEEDAQFTKETVWSRQGRAWFDNLMDRMNRSGCQSQTKGD